jgi:hypothetical protein
MLRSEARAADRESDPASGVEALVGNRSGWQPHMLAHVLLAFVNIDKLPSCLVSA